MVTKNWINIKKKKNENYIVTALASTIEHGYKIQTNQFMKLK